MPPLRNLPLPTKTLQEASFTSLQERMSKDLFAFDAEQRKENDALSLERIGGLQLPEEPSITGTTGYESMLGTDDMSPMSSDMSPMSAPDSESPTTQPASRTGRTTGLMTPTLDMPAMSQPRRQAIYDPTSTVDIQGEPDYDPSADTGTVFSGPTARVVPGSPGQSAAAPADPSSWEGKAYASAVKAGHPNPQQFVEQVRWESGNFDPDVIAGTRKSRAGAEGIAQIVRRYHPNVDPLNPDAALDYAARLMKSHYDQYGDSDTALAAYNGGAGAVAAMRAGHPYDETQQYLREINSRVTERAAIAAPATPPTQRAAESRAQTGETRLQGVTPPQFGLGDADADAICGPVLAMAFAQSTGRNPTIVEAKQMATQHGGWTSARGMGGPEAMANTLRQMGIPAHYAPGALDVETIRRETKNGNPVGINTAGHYFVVEGVDADGRLDLGNSAKALRASGGRQWFRPEEIPGLGMGAPTGAIYKDSPSSPVPSVAVTQTRMPTVSGAIQEDPTARRERDAFALTADLPSAGAPGAGSPLPASAGGSDLALKVVPNGTGIAPPTTAELPPPTAGTSLLDQQRSMDWTTNPQLRNQAVPGGGAALEEGPEGSFAPDPSLAYRNPLDATPVRDRWGDEPAVPLDPDQGPREQPYPGTVTPIQNPNGSVTTERSITVTEPELNQGQPTNIPTVWSGRVVDDDTAITNAVNSRRAFPSYPTIDAAVTAAEQRSEDLGAGRAVSVGGAVPFAPYDPDQGPREALPGSVGASNLGPGQATAEEEGQYQSQQRPQVQFSTGGPPTPGGVWTPMPVTPTPAQPAAPAPSGFPGLQAVYDAAGNFLHWIQGGEPAPAPNVAARDASLTQNAPPRFGGERPTAETLAPPGPQLPATRIEDLPADRLYPFGASPDETRLTGAGLVPPPQFPREPIAPPAHATTTPVRDDWRTPPLTPPEPLPGTPTLPGRVGHRVNQLVENARRSPTQQMDPNDILDIAGSLLPTAVVNEVLTRQIDEGEWRNIVGTDPLAPFRAEARRRGIMLPSPQEINPDGYPAISVWGGLAASLLMPDPSDPLVGRALAAVGRGVRRTAEVIVPGVAGAAYGAAQPAESWQERADRALAYGGLAAAGGSLAPALTSRAGQAALHTVGRGARSLVEEAASPAARAAEQAPGVRHLGSGVVPEASAPRPAENAPTFFSQLRRTIEQKMPNRAGAQQVEGILKGSAVKPDEIAWTGFDDWLREQRGPVTKQQALDFLDQHAVRVEEVVRGGDDPLRLERNRLMTELENAQAAFDRPRVEEIRAQLDEAERARREGGGAAKETRYGQYTLPGGENYRELLLTLPPARPQAIEPLTKLPDGYNLIHYGSDPGREWGVIPSGQAHARAFAGQHATQEEAVTAALERLNNESNQAARETARGKDYRSAHWDEPNILAHVRFNDRVAPDGAKTLLIEEVQSDWHQTGRKQGYADPKRAPDLERQLTDVRGERSTLWQETEGIGRAPTSEQTARMQALDAEGERLYAALNTAKGSQIPDAPFKKTWPELALKRTIRWAAENGYDRIAWPPGDVHNARYNLTQHVDELFYTTKDGAVGTLVARKGGRDVVTQENIPADKLKDYVGQDVANRMLSMEPDTVRGADQYYITGRDLAEFGGEGMRGFYDQILPTTAQKIGKKFGARVGETKIDVPTTWNSSAGEALQPGKTQAVHSMDITPQMRQSVMQEGQPLFANVGIRPSLGLRADAFNAAQGATLGAVSEDMQAQAEGRESDPGERIARAVGAGALAVAGGRVARRGAPGARVGSGVVPEGGGTVRGPQRRPAGVPGQQPIKLTAAEEVSRLRLDKFPAEVRDLIQQSAGEQGFAHAQRRGVLPDAVVQQLAQSDAKPVDDLIKNGRAGKQYSAEETLAVRNAVASQAIVVRELSEEIAQARANNMTPDLLIARRAAEATKLNGLVQVAEGARAEAGRTLRAYRQQAELIDLNPQEAIQQIYKRLGGKENAEKAVDDYTKLIQDGADPIKLAKFWAKVEAGKITGSDLFSLFRRFNMLSGPRTLEVNALSGAVNLGYEVATQAVGQAARGRLGEAAAEVAAPFKAMGRAFGNMAETMWHGVSAEQAARGDIPRNLSARTDNRAAKAALTVAEVPDRLNAGVDQFFRTMTEDWAVTRLAQQQARDVHLTPRSSSWAETVAKNIETIRNDPSKFPQIKEIADHVTFSEEPGPLGQGLEALRRKSPLVMNVLAPFIRTPYNIASRAVDLSPLGVPRTAIEVATGKGRGTQNISRRVRDNVLGVAAAYWAYDQAQQGNLTGAGPDDPEKIAELRATGWQPYSVRINNPVSGKTEYWSYANFAPFSLALSSGAAAAEAQKYAKPGQTDTLSMLADGAGRTAKVVTDMTVLAGIGAVIKAQQDPERYGGQWLTQFLQTLIPAGSALNTVGQMTDPIIRRAERDSFGNQVKGGLAARLPDFLSPISPIGTRQDVPAARKPLGEMVPNDQTGIAALNPFRPTTERRDRVYRAFIDAGVDIGAPPRTMAGKDAMGRQVPITLTPSQQRQYQSVMGQEVRQRMGDLVDQLPAMPREERQKRLQTVLRESREVAADQFRAAAALRGQ